MCRSALLAGLLVSLTFIIYGPCLHGSFLWDDDAHVSHNTTLTTLTGLHDIWFKPGAVQQYYPVTYTAFWIQYHLWGLHPLGYHIVNVLLHGCDAILFWMLLESLGISGAWIAAWLFAWHPVMVESVAWISELKNTLSTFFYLISVLCLVKSEQSESGEGWLYGISFLSFLAALLSKSVTATLPVSFLVIGMWMNGGFSKNRILKLLPFLGTGCGIGVFTLHMEHEMFGALRHVRDFSFLERVLLASRNIWFYIGKLIDPSPLVFIYPRWSIAPPYLALYLYPIAILALAGLLMYGGRWWGKFPFACFLFFVITLGPALGFTNFYPMRFSFVADHFQYLASFGLFALAGWSLSALLDLLQNRQLSIPGVFILLLIGANLALATNRQACTYSDSLSLWQHTLNFNPDSAIVHHNLGIALLDHQEWNSAVAHLRTAEALDPTFPQTHLALAYLALHANRREDALHHYKEAIRLGISDPVVLRDYAALHEKKPR